MNRIKQLIEAEIAKEHGGLIAKVMLSRVGIRAGINISKIDENTPYDPELAKKLLNAASQILNRPIQEREYGYQSSPFRESKRTMEELSE
ncbi:MAG: hypothetical protein D6767_04495 [Candidatus Hydrogenedentota bacterium]|nr:MAG: hypothetical protein D6767_04495 [Candidatus Hydrogenedentota bacterium]